MHPSPCGRFLILEALHVDRDVMDPLVGWSERQGLAVQDAVQLAIVFFTERVVDADADEPPGVAARASPMAAATSSPR